MRKYEIVGGGAPKKLDVLVDVPELVDIEFLRGKGLQPGEEALPEEGEDKIKLDDNIINELMNMGFPRGRCEKAAFHNQGKGLSDVMEWLLSHMDDPDIDKPIPTSGTSATSVSKSFPNESILQLQDMGFTRDQAIKALRNTDGDAARAVDWLFSHPDDSGDSMEVEEKEELSDGPGKYRLLAIISHMGGSTLSGHYVCHIKKEGKWVLFNDQKVAISEDPPKDMGYLYVFERYK